MAGNLAAEMSFLRPHAIFNFMIGKYFFPPIIY
jgi:hypothetical protein